MTPSSAGSNAGATQSPPLQETAGEKKPTSVLTKLGISVLSSAVGTAAGLYVVKKRFGVRS